MDTRDKLIVRQVAFKGAIEILTKSPEEWNSASVIAEVRLLTDEFENIIQNENKASEQSVL